MIYLGPQEIIDLDKDLGQEKQKPLIVVWFSCGAASAIAWKKTEEIYGKTHRVVAVNNPIKNEHEDNLRFMRDVENWVGTKIVTAGNRLYPSNDINDVFKKRRYMSGVEGASCTMSLKKEARYQFELENNITYHVLGFTLDEKPRSDKFIKFERANVLQVLISERITKQDCFNILEQAGIKRPEIYKILPNANCIGCVKATSPTYWNLIRKHFPETFDERAKLSREIGCKLVRVKGERMFLDELPVDAKGGKIKSYECGIFCDTK